jgi:hypothetical protein
MSNAQEHQCGPARLNIPADVRLTERPKLAQP